MKLYKFDYKGAIGNNVITVPTDSQFLIGISNGDVSSTAQLFDGTTEILPEDDKIGEYTCFRMETQGTQFRKPYKAVIEGKNINLLVICKKMSVAYRDETGITASEAVDAVKESGEFLGKTKIGQFDYYVPDEPIMMADNKDFSLLGGNFSISTTEETGAATVLEAYADSENEKLTVTGVVNAADLKLEGPTIEQPIFNASIMDSDGNEYIPDEITVVVGGVEKTVLAFVCQNV